MLQLEPVFGLHSVDFMLCLYLIWKLYGFGAKFADMKDTNSGWIGH